MANLNKVPCGGFEIGNGLIGLRGGVVDSRVKALKVYRDATGEWLLFEERNYIKSYQELEKSFSYGNTIVVENTTPDTLICSTVHDITFEENNGLGFNVIAFDSTNKTMTYSTVFINKDFTLSAKDYTYALTPIA